MQSFQTLLKGRWNFATIIVSVVLVGFIASLVVKNYLSQLELQGYALEQLKQDIEKRATAVSYFYSERRNDLKNLAESREISIFFENKALGMSMEYGLRASLLAVSETFNRLLEERKLGEDRIYSRITFVGSNGELLVDTQPIDTKQKHKEDLKRFLKPERSVVTLIKEHVDNSLKLIVTIPYFFKEKYIGQIIAWISPKTVYKNLIKTEAGFSQRIISIDCGKGNLYFLESMPLKAAFSNVLDLSMIKIGTPYRFEVPRKDGVKLKMLAMKVPIEETPSFLVAVLPASEVFGPTAPWHLPLGMGILSLAILGGMAIVLRINASNLVLNIRLEESSKREREIEEKNLQLQKEITERMQAEEALRRAHDELEIRVQERTAGLAETNESLQAEIIERKQAAEALEQSEEKYRTLVENIQDGVFIIQDAKMQFFNEAFARMVGYSVEEVIGMDFQQLVAPEDLEMVSDRYIRRQAGEYVPNEYEFRMLHKDGVTRVIVNMNVGLINYHSRIASMGTVKDITERKRAEEALQFEREQLLSIFDSINEIIYVADPNTHEILYANKTLQDAFQKSLVGGICYREFQGLESPCEFCTNEIILKEKGKPYRWEYHNPILERDYIIVDRVIKWPDGRDVRFELAIDITERKQAEEALLESERLYRLLAENVTDVIWTMDMDLRFTYISPSVKRFRGYSVEEAMAQTLDEILTPASLEVAMKTYIEEMAIEGMEQKDRARSLTLELEHTCKDGSTVWAETKIGGIRGSDGRLVKILGVTRDTTERKLLEEQLLQSQKMEAVGRLAGGVAHDFNNLLTIIKGYSQLSLLEMKEGDPLKVNTEEIQRAADRAANLTRQLLAFSRRQILEMRVLDLNTTLRDLEKMLRRIIGEDVELVTFMAEDLGNVKADPGQMEQVIMNLAVNARDAMPRGGKLTIETANVRLDEAYARGHVAVKPGHYVILSVSDTGVGMTPEVKERIFEPFFTTKEKGKGTGLGLSTVYGIVKQSGGNIWVYSEPGQGTTFKIYFPRVDEPLDDVEKIVVQEELPRGSETILVVEDNEEVLKLAVRVLEKQGYNVLEASTGDEALLLCERRKEPIHLLLVDVVMPGMSGLKLVEKLRYVCGDFKALYMSGYTDNAITHHGVLKKGVNFIQKPFTVEGLARKVREILNK